LSQDDVWAAKLEPAQPRVCDTGHAFLPPPSRQVWLGSSAAAASHHLCHLNPLLFSPNLLSPSILLIHLDHRPLNRRFLHFRPHRTDLVTSRRGRIPSDHHYPSIGHFSLNQHAGTMASVSSLDQDMRKLRLSRYTPSAANEARAWIEEILNEQLASGDLLDALKDGTALCK
jgi:hypothetical protein